MELVEALRLAKNVAISMTRDPEAESLAGLAAWKAQQTFDASKNVPWEAWVIRLTRQHVQYYCRQKKSRIEKTFSDMNTTEDADFAETVIQPPLDEDRPNIPDADWQLLVENLVEKCPVSVLVRRYRMSDRKVRAKLEAAKYRLVRELSA